VVQAGAAELAHGVHQATQEEGVPERPHHSEDEDGAQVLGELAQREEIAGIQDDGWEEEEEEDIRVEDGGLFTHPFDEPPNQKAHHDEQAALGNDVGN